MALRSVSQHVPTFPAPSHVCGIADPPLAVDWAAAIGHALLQNLELGRPGNRQAVLNKRTYTVGASSLTLEFGDITNSTADAIVSSDDSYITMGGGVSAAILRAGGETVLVDAAKHVPAALGDVVVTAAGLLPAKHIFHAITIDDATLEPREIIARTTRRSLELLGALNLSSIAFPAIGAGVAGFELSDVASQMADAIVSVLLECDRSVAVTIYLHDSFGHMAPLDYVEFFEQFALKTNRLTFAAPRFGSGGEPDHPPPPSRAQTRRDERAELIRRLGRLEGERQVLEARLARYENPIEATEEHEIEKRLRDVHRERVEVLAEVNKDSVRSASRVFVSYAHEDDNLRKQLGKHLSTLERQGLIATWHDRMIGAGSEWEGAIDERLEQATVILLLVSSDFVNSKYCYDVEMRRALERHEAREALVIPVILRPVVLQGLPFGRLQALPRDARPATEWPSLDSAFVNITEGLRDSIAALSTRLPNSALHQTVPSLRSGPAGER